MSGKCVYAVTVQDKEVPVEAANQSQAIRIATRQLVTGCRPLKGHEVLALYRDKVPILTDKGQVGGEEPDADGNNAEFDPPADDGKFEGDVAFMDPEDSTKGTHKWESGAWVAIAPEEKPLPLKGASRTAAAEPPAE